jgi:hypothetical protein
LIIATYTDFREPPHRWDIWYLPEVKIEIEAVLAALRDDSLGIEVEAA